MLTSFSKCDRVAAWSRYRVYDTYQSLETFGLVNCTEFDTIRNAAGSNNFVLSVKAWIERTGAIGVMKLAVMEVHTPIEILPTILACG